jgi:hypothetical protein
MPRETPAVTGQESPVGGAGTHSTSLSGNGSDPDALRLHGSGESPPPAAQSGDIPGATIPPTSNHEGGQNGTHPDGPGDMCPSGDPQNPFGPTPDAPFGFYRSGEKMGQPKTSAAGRPPKGNGSDALGPQVAQTADAAAKSADPSRISSVRRAGPRPQAKNAASATVSIDYEQVARAFAGTWFGVGALAFGDDWLPNEEAGEHIQVKDAFKRYVEARGIGDFPPGIALALALGTYSLARVTKPTVKERLGLIWGRIKGVGAWARNKLPGRRSAN